VHPPCVHPLNQKSHMIFYVCLQCVDNVWQVGLQLGSRVGHWCVMSIVGWVFGPVVTCTPRQAGKHCTIGSILPWDTMERPCEQQKIPSGNLTVCY
jgi:hypothetical protein